MNTSEEMIVKLTTYKLKGGAFSWWKLQMDISKREGRAFVRSWMQDKFLPMDYDHYLFHWYQYCLQWNKYIHKYNAEFWRLTQCNHLQELESQQVITSWGRFHAQIRSGSCFFINFFIFLFLFSLEIPMLVGFYINHRIPFPMRIKFKSRTNINGYLIYFSK